MSAIGYRERLKAQPFRPFIVKTADGDTFRVEHPDFSIVSPLGTEVIIYDKDGHFRHVAMNLIVSLEPVREQARKVGKR